MINYNLTYNIYDINILYHHYVTFSLSWCSFVEYELNIWIYLWRLSGHPQSYKYANRYHQQWADSDQQVHTSMAKCSRCINCQIRQRKDDNHTSTRWLVQIFSWKWMKLWTMRWNSMAFLKLTDWQHHKLLTTDYLRCLTDWLTTDSTPTTSYWLATLTSELTYYTTNYWLTTLNCKLTDYTTNY